MAWSWVEFWWSVAAWLTVIIGINVACWGSGSRWRWGWYERDR